MTDFLQSSLAWAARGMPVFPLQHRFCSCGGHAKGLFWKLSIPPGNDTTMAPTASPARSVSFVWVMLHAPPLAKGRVNLPPKPDGVRRLWLRGAFRKPSVCRVSSG